MARILIACVDFRLAQMENHRLLPPDAYRISVVGGAKGVIKWKEATLAQLDELVTLGVAMDELIILDHTDCKAYGGITHETEADHLHHLQGAALLVTQRFPHVLVRKWLLDLEQRRIKTF